ncbi:hypothetical protein K4F52_003183 [Lecanicillium sp. MT-2017a]|nr:hypothetical protein K4F52_003183 [Lecanicillium sp. MT-2017a]
MDSAEAHSPSVPSPEGPRSLHYADDAAAVFDLLDEAGRNGEDAFTVTEGDSSGGPIPERMAGDAWPTLVIQSGVSQSLRDLQESIRWWFSASDHEVKIVLLIKIDRQQQKVTIENWTEGVDVPRPDATAVTRSATTLSPICRQEITIEISPAAAAAEPGAPIRDDAASYTVTGGDLRLEFELLFLRQSDAERDVIITADTLRDMGRILWYW